MNDDEIFDLLASSSRDDGQLRELIAHSRTPVIRRIDADTCEVAFFHDSGSAEAVPRVKLTTLIDRGLPERRELIPLAGSALQHLVLRLPSNLRFSYDLHVEEPDGGWRKIGDPGNPTPWRDERLQSPVAHLPDAEPLDVIRRLPESSSRLDELWLDSQALGAERRVWISLPPDHGVDSSPMPVVVVFDGSVRHTAPAVRDALVARRQSARVAVVLVDQHGRRNEDLTANPAFSDLFAQSYFR